MNYISYFLIASFMFCVPLKMELIHALATSLLSPMVRCSVFEVGLVAGRRMQDLKKVGWFLIAFAVVMPLIHGLLGVLIGTWTGLSIGGTCVARISHHLPPDSFYCSHFSF